MPTASASQCPSEHALVSVHVHGEVGWRARDTWGWGLIPGSMCPQRAVPVLCWISVWWRLDQPFCGWPGSPVLTPPRATASATPCKVRGRSLRGDGAAWMPCLGAALWAGQDMAGGFTAGCVHRGVHAWGLMQGVHTESTVSVRAPVFSAAASAHARAKAWRRRVHSYTRRLWCAGLRVCAWVRTMARGPVGPPAWGWERRHVCAPTVAGHGGRVADPHPSQALGQSRTPGCPSLAPGAPGGAPALAAVPASPHAPHPWHCLASPGQGAGPWTPLPCRAGPGTCRAPVPTLTPPPLPPGAAQGEEKSLGASAQSAMLSNLRPDTEYVVTLRPRYAQQPAIPSTLTARTRKHCTVPGLSRGQG